MDGYKCLKWAGSEGLMSGRHCEVELLDWVHIGRIVPVAELGALSASIGDVTGVADMSLGLQVTASFVQWMERWSWLRRC